MRSNPKPAVIIGWAALTVVMPVSILLLIWEAATGDLPAFICAILGVSLLAAGFKLADLIDQLENPNH